MKLKKLTEFSINHKENEMNKINFATDWKYFAILPAVNFNCHCGIVLEIEWLFFGIYVEIIKP